MFLLILVVFLPLTQQQTDLKKTTKPPATTSHQPQITPTPKTCDKSVEAIYWKDLSNNTPSDAIVGGKDLCNRPMIIGQAVVSANNLQVVRIYQTLKFVWASIGPKVIKADQFFIRVLCAEPQDHMKFNWLEVDGKNMQEIVKNYSMILVKGGLEMEQPLYIGRVMYQNEMIVGKVLQNRLYFPFNKHVESSPTFEVLTYKEFSNEPTPSSKAA